MKPLNYRCKKLKQRRDKNEKYESFHKFVIVSIDRLKFDSCISFEAILIFC